MTAGLASNPAITRKVNIYRKETSRWRIVNPLSASLDDSPLFPFPLSFPS
jgi:hypothetical protein